MDFVLIRGKPFSEHFDFKNDKGKPIVVPSGQYKLIVEHGPFAREYKVGSGLSKTRNAILINISAQDTKDFAYSAMYYTLYLNNTELARGILRVQ
jgi:hypothetical protein